MVNSMKIYKIFEVGQNFVATNKVMLRQFLNLCCDIGSFCRDKEKSNLITVAGNYVATHILSVATKLVLTFDLQ